MDTIIERELAAFSSSGISKNMVDQTFNSSPLPLVKVQIIDNRVYLWSKFQHHDNIAILLNRLCQNYGLPNMEFLVVHLDGVHNLGKFKPMAPIFASAKCKGIDRVVLYVDGSTMMEPESLSYVSWFRMSNEVEEASISISWETKIDKIFWRGGPTDGSCNPEKWNHYPRGRLVELSLKYPQDFDAGFTWYYPSSDEAMRSILPILPDTSLTEHIKYKYQIALDGVICTYPGYQWRLLSNCLVFKPESNQIQWFYSELKPWVHYVPVLPDLSDLHDKLHWARENDDMARQIAENGRDFAKRNLMPDQQDLYFYKLLIRYASLMHYQPTLGK